jgi:NAD(P)-dependent dehydrogenase (short-subunit alcohol dehydrogenase family)
MSPAIEARKVAIITGASGGIGAGLVDLFRATGYRVVGTVQIDAQDGHAIARAGRSEAHMAWRGVACATPLANALGTAVGADRLDGRPDTLRAL